MEIFTDRRIHGHQYTQYVFLSCQPRGPRSSNTPVVTSTINAKILISHAVLQQKKPRLLGETAKTRIRAGSVQDKPVALCGASSKQADKQTELHRDIGVERAPNITWKVENVAQKLK